MTATTTAPPKPVLRGWFHALMVPTAMVGAAWLLFQAAAASGLAGRLAVGVFGLCLVGLYTVSSVYHVPRWPARVRYVLSRFDVAMIQLFIAATFTPVAFYTLQGPWRTWSLVVAWAIALAGAGVSISPLRAPRWLSTLGFMAFGWLAIVPMTRVVQALPWEGIGLIALGGLLYTLGAIVYVRRRPDPFPRWFGYHEIFHLFVVAASVSHYFAIWRYVLPGH